MTRSIDDWTKLGGDWRRRDEAEHERPYSQDVYADQDEPLRSMMAEHFAADLGDPKICANYDAALAALVAGYRMPTAVELWLSHVGRGAPSNAAGQRSGLGWTKAKATEAAGHWANQAPYERHRKHVLRDGGHRTPEEEAIAAAAFEYLGDIPRRTDAERIALDHYRAGRWASAWLTLHRSPRA